MNLLDKSLFADLRFVSIYLWQNKRIGENFNETHLQKIFFRKFKNYKIM